MLLALTIKADQYDAFKACFEAEVKARISETQRIPSIQIDFEIQLSDITPKFFRILKQFEPFGPDNMTPVFMSSAVSDSGFGKAVGFKRRTFTTRCEARPKHRPSHWLWAWQ